MTVPTLSNVTFLFRLDPGLVAWGHGSTVPRSIQEEEKEGWKGKGQEGKREKGKEEVVLSSRQSVCGILANLCNSQLEREWGFKTYRTSK